MVLKNSNDLILNNLSQHRIGLA